jgi:hypothetical protein
VSVLVGEVAQMRELQERIAPVLTGQSPSEDSAEVLRRVQAMLSNADRDAMIRDAAKVHNLIHEVAPDDMYPCDHLIDMLSSCTSAIRFGFEAPCHSRHAAEAANHIWKQKYGVRLFDSFTPAWQKDWARAQLREAILRLALTPAPLSPTV